MNHEELLTRRRELIARSDAQREEVAGVLRGWNRAFQRVDRAVELATRWKLGLLWRGAKTAFRLVSAVRGLIT